MLCIFTYWFAARSIYFSCVHFRLQYVIILYITWNQAQLATWPASMLQWRHLPEFPQWPPSACAAADQQTQKQNPNRTCQQSNQSPKPKWNQAKLINHKPRQRDLPTIQPILNNEPTSYQQMTCHDATSRVISCHIRRLITTQWWAPQGLKLGCLATNMYKLISCIKLRGSSLQDQPRQPLPLIYPTNKQDELVEAWQWVGFHWL